MNTSVFENEKEIEAYNNLLRLESIINEIFDIRQKHNITDEMFVELFGYKNDTGEVEVKRDLVIQNIKYLI